MLGSDLDFNVLVLLFGMIKTIMWRICGGRGDESWTLDCASGSTEVGVIADTFDMNVAGASLLSPF